jgi:hypothetical protein
MVTSNNSALNKGIAKLENRLIILLDLSKVLSLDENQELNGVPAAV